MTDTALAFGMTPDQYRIRNLDARVAELEARVNSLTTVVAAHQDFNLEMIKTLEHVKATMDGILLILHAIVDDDGPMTH